MEKDKNPKKTMQDSNTLNEDKIHFDNNHLKFLKGDIDELIFPDDEPYYISER